MNYNGIRNANGDTVLSRTTLTIEEAREEHFLFEKLFDDGIKFMKETGKNFYLPFGEFNFND
jgi:hypothetical protein